MSGYHALEHLYLFFDARDQRGGDLHEVVPAITSHPTITHLTLSFYYMSMCELTQHLVADILHQNARLRYFCLFAMEFYEQPYLRLVDGLRVTPSLREFTVTTELLGFIQALKHNKSLVKFSFKDNDEYMDHNRMEAP